MAADIDNLIQKIVDGADNDDSGSMRGLVAALTADNAENIRSLTKAFGKYTQDDRKWKNKFSKDFDIWKIEHKNFIDKKFDEVYSRVDDVEEGKELEQQERDRRAKLWVTGIMTFGVIVSALIGLFT